MIKKILLISGDPYSVNTEIIFKAWKKIKYNSKSKIYLISNYKLIKAQLKKLNYSLKICKVDNINQQTKNDCLKLINVNMKFNNPYIISKKNRAVFVKNCLDKAHHLASQSTSIGIINCAIDKTLLSNQKIGVTEYLAGKCKVKKDKEVMLIKNKNLSVIPITTHIDIKEISKKISSKKIITKVISANDWFKRYMKKKPKIGILGLNPHNAELRKKSEENKIIIPAIKKLLKLKVKIKGPLVSDTVFIEDYKKFDLIVGMFHDQVLSPFKAIFKFDAINITLGLKYLRVSPDHGTAVNLINKKIAKPDSLIKCINFLHKIR